MNLDVLLPILRKDRDGWEEIAPCWPVAPGIAVYLAEVTPTPEGGQKIAYVLKQHLTSGTPKASALLERSFKGFMALTADAGPSQGVPS